MARLVSRKNAGELLKSVPGKERAGVLDHMVDNDAVSIRNGGRALAIVAAAVPIGATALVAYVLAGKSTTLNVEVTVALSLALVGVTGVLGLLLRNRRQEIRRLRGQNSVLTKGMHEMQKRLRDHGIDDTIKTP